MRSQTTYPKVTERMLYRLVQDEKLPTFGVGIFWRFRREDLERWFSEQPRGTGTNRQDD